MNVQTAAIVLALGAPFILISSALHMRRNLNNSRQYFATAFALLIWPNIAIMIALVGGSSNFGIISALFVMFLGPILAFIGALYFIGGHVRGRFAGLRYDMISLVIVVGIAGVLAAYSGALG